MQYREVFCEFYILGTIRELSVFEEGQVATYPTKIEKQAKIVKYSEVFCEKCKKSANSENS